MRKLHYILLLINFISILSCEDVINVDVNTSDPRLVIDASLNWTKGTNGENQTIKLSLTAPFFDTTVPPATGASVTVTDSDSNVFNFNEIGDTGIYINNSFIPVINNVYNLTVVYNNETYTATETLTSVAPIEFIEQKNDGGFTGEETEIKAYYTDPEGVDNYYLFEFIIPSENIQSLEVYDDEFTDGNQIFGFYSDDTLETGDELIVRVSGISERNFEFFNILLQQTDDEQGDPFQVQPVTVRGNCINQTNPNNFPLGYFRVSETSSATYTIE
ncbi:DUF4249 domain-containing protein [Flavivirga eckloniae]|uniref:DUF4249 domain-containing protein n=1 Tax=Flavivirga eckloniae TaxID=1803846 RepID=A0A2K9PLG4_9FLAO|nr:DUF4249 domain-containing protein [Flavivirga eckloniae]AUP77865.1 DUF4249 domain-containing protein [Flavivirga eckloniae]